MNTKQNIQDLVINTTNALASLVETSENLLSAHSSTTFCFMKSIEKDNNAAFSFMNTDFSSLLNSLRLTKDKSNYKKVNNLSSHYFPLLADKELAYFA